MRKLVLAIAVLALGIACSSKPKATNPQAQTTAPTASATKDQAQSTSKKKSKKTKAAAVTAGTVVCTHDKDQRTIAVQAKDSGCEVMYTKMGETKSVATAAHGNQHCQDVSGKIQKNLTGAGYSCQ